MTNMKIVLFSRICHKSWNGTREFYIRYHPTKFIPPITHKCKKADREPFKRKKPLDEVKSYHRDLLMHLVGMTRNGNYPSIRLLMCFDQHSMLGSERIYYKSLFRYHGFETYKIKSSMVDYVFRRSHPYLRVLQPLFYCDSIIVASKIGDTSDPWNSFKKVMKLLSKEQPKMFYSRHRVPISNRFILTGGRIDFNIYNAKNLEALVKMKPQQKIVEDTYCHFGDLLRMPHLGLVSQLRILSNNIDFLINNK
ncbi:hypothetical protein RF11_16513 [Thelohanellus kitauei]|uniref:Uncharacterized protein n=1 Tax=Thelohanellus kitauei TaxID=669202 RepID=A0A0C2N6X1_THEKT|nr:hypothetical protein RF11_16513 [Thelohanellus kitauei]